MTDQGRYEIGMLSPDYMPSVSGSEVVHISEQHKPKGYDISIMWHGSIYHGDHSETCDIAEEYIPGETVEHLVERVLPELVAKARGEKKALPIGCTYADHIEIRVVEPKEEGNDDTT